MNTRAVKWAWKQPIQPEKRRLLLLGLAILSNNMGAVEASQNRIMKETGMARRTLINHLKGLENDGYLFRKKNYRKNGRRAVNTYYLSHGGSSRHIDKNPEEKKLEQEILGNPEEYPGLL